MKSLLVLLCSSLMFFSAAYTEEAPVETPAEIPSQVPSIHWYSSLEAAKQANPNSLLPFYICFTGYDWCFWCQRLEKEIQSQPEFIQKVYDKFIFVRINIPKDPSQADTALREFMLKWKVYGVPVILILSQDLKELGRLSYQKISPIEFADLALQIKSAT